MNRFLKTGEIDQAASKVAMGMIADGGPRQIRLYPVPRGGIPAAWAIANQLAHLRASAHVVGDPENANYIVDDLVDSGATRSRYQNRFPKIPFRVLFDKKEDDKLRGLWLIFPWEGDGEKKEESFTDNITRLLQFIGEKPEREGLQETPARVAKAWKHWTSGYDKDAKTILKVFKDGGEKYNQMISVVNIPIYSKCEHHLADIFGTATISYIPNGHIVGLSKLSRIADMFARRLQVQERLTDQIADALDTHLTPKGVGVLIKARHLCMESRGICQQGHHTVTTALRGVMLTEQSARDEFLRLAQ
jgi:GTP cyclohydrolase I